MSRRLRLLPALAIAAVTLTATAAAADTYTPTNCFRARDWQNWKAPAPNVLLVKAGTSGMIWRIDLQQGSDQLKYSDVRIINRNIQRAWLCGPSDFDLLLTDSHHTMSIPLIVTSMRRLTPDEVEAIPPRDRP